MLTSKGMAGVPGSSLLALSATVGAIGHGDIPVAAVALLLGADRIMDSMRVSVNLSATASPPSSSPAGKATWTRTASVRSSPAPPNRRP
ncbi:cation:dicarboxylate symporter family transporter, partial [Nonomuraea aridisoli]|uniref:cation:dicarboxylate symporter family transporter n=1 Tax=Nonomuraea aridisoli TaxID=2070368 RepID=UPI0022A88BDA